MIFHLPTSFSLSTGVSLLPRISRLLCAASTSSPLSRSARFAGLGARFSSTACSSSASVSPWGLGAAKAVINGSGMRYCMRVEKCFRIYVRVSHAAAGTQDTAHREGYGFLHIELAVETRHLWAVRYAHSFMCLLHCLLHQRDQFIVAPRWRFRRI